MNRGRARGWGWGGGVRVRKDGGKAMEEVVKLKGHSLKSLPKGKLVGCQFADSIFEGERRIGHGRINKSTKNDRCKWLSY